MVEHQRYMYRLIWSEVDNEHVALCAEFPSLSFLAETPQGALKGIMRTVADVVQDMEENGEPVPLPLATKTYSGKFQVRIPPEQHRNLAIEAAEQGVSINRLVAAKLTCNDLQSS